ncbi:lipopolysaccharide biosynthesis protein [Deinococcus sp. QL22]|uniref:lipopolysaccharide biosynthesis protein n=1 Tax=Deinococcus sp. QL22 TaxID=2939437 RepID=UPI002017496C|nr:lipopolysaccharide biosynthesis protein [Deinococcus sp. QL22]UQN09697.1 lipopolysaccharide biosynthesis protein [Deinococcus sp. QL22]
MTGLKDKTMRAIKWSSLSFLTTILLTPLFAAILARLLSKEEFGLFAIGLSLYAVGQYIADFGIAQALVQKSDLTEEDIRAGFTSSVLLGLLATALAWLLAPAAGDFFNNADVTPFMRAYACVYVIASLATVSTSLLRRALRFKPLMVVEVGSYIIGQGVFGLGAAYLGLGAYSLIVSAAVQAVIQLSVSYFYGRHPFGFTFRRESYRALYAFGGRASLVNFLEFLSTNLDTLMIGRFYGTGILGLYNRGYNVIYAPMIGLARSLTRVLAPSFSVVQHDQAKLRSSYLSGLMALSILLFSIAASAFISAREIVLVLLGESFISVVPIVQVLALFIPFPVLGNLSAVLAEASARLNAKILVQSVYLVGLAAAYWMAYRLGWGILGFASVLTVAGAIRSAAYAVVARRIIGGGGKEIVRAYTVGLVYGLGMAAVMFMVIYPLRQFGLSPFVLLGIEVLLSGALLVALLLLGPTNELQNQVRTLIRNIISRTGRWWKDRRHVKGT